MWPIGVRHDAESFSAILTKASAGIFLRHPDEASNASGWKDLGQLRVSEAGTGF